MHAGEGGGQDEGLSLWSPHDYVTKRNTKRLVTGVDVNDMSLGLCIYHLLIAIEFPNLARASSGNRPNNRLELLFLIRQTGIRGSTSGVSARIWYITLWWLNWGKSGIKVDGSALVRCLAINNLLTKATLSRNRGQNSSICC